MKIQEQIFELYNISDYEGRKELIKILKEIALDLEKELNVTCSQCLEHFSDCYCEEGLK